MNLRRMGTLILVLLVMLIPTMSVAAARDSVSLSCHFTVYSANCDGFSVTAIVDNEVYYVKAYVKTGLTWSPISCTGGNCTSNGNFLLTPPSGSTRSGSWTWAQTSLDELLLCAPQVLKLQLWEYVPSSGTHTKLDKKRTAFGGPLCCHPDAVDLASYELVPGKGGVLIKWETGCELTNLGFDLYRARGSNLAAAVKINQEVIPSKALGSIKGASYEFLDATARAGVTYNYWLQDIDAASAPGDADAYLMGVRHLGAGHWSQPKNLRVLPASSGKPGGTPQRFIATFRDADADLATLYMVIGTTPEFGKGIAVKYDVASGELSMYDGRRGGWQEGIQAHQRKNLSCQYGSLQGFRSRVLQFEEGKVIRVVFMLKMWLRFQGQHQICMRSEDLAGNSTGWSVMGTWDVQ